MKTPQQLLQQTLEVGACLLPDAASGGRTPYPAVFVHGLLGWGARDALYRAVPYWGLAAGDVLGYLNACGYDCRAASVGIISSAWDRACELYAELTGGTADYGIAHAQRFGHARFGTAYPAPLVPGWGADRPIDLVGHSFGGATARLLLQLLADGCPEEVQAAAAAGETPSPLFTGGKAGWVHTLVAIAAPHDGSTFLDVQPDAADALSTLFLGAARALGISAFKGVYDFRLDQFGIRRDPDEPLTTAALRMLAQNPLPAGDSAFDDLRPAGARALNARIRTLPDTWYFSIPCCRTLPRLLTHDQKPDAAMTPLLWPFSTAMGRDGAGMLTHGKTAQRRSPCKICLLRRMFSYAESAKAALLGAKGMLCYGSGISLLSKSVLSSIEVRESPNFLMRERSWSSCCVSRTAKRSSALNSPTT